MASDSIYRQVHDFDNRCDPYSLSPGLRKAPGARQWAGTYVVRPYQEIVALLHDPRVSSDRRSRADPPNAQPGSEAGPAGFLEAFIGLDPPEHDRLRRLTMRHFGPPQSPGKVDSAQPEFLEIITGLIDGIADRKQADIVDDIAYPFPVTVICRLLGVPRDDEPRFHVWADTAAENVGPREGH